MDANFEAFIRKSRYFSNVSPRTIQWYRKSFKWLGTPPTDARTLKAFVIRMREAGLKPSSCNNGIRAVNAFLKWSASPLKIPRLKEQEQVLPTFRHGDIQRFASVKPKSPTQLRLQCVVLTLADTGCRIDEALYLRWSDVEFDDLLLTLHGKGGKQRKVPFSFELRRFLWKLRPKWNHDLVFATKSSRKLGRRVCAPAHLLCHPSINVPCCCQPAW